MPRAVAEVWKSLLKSNLKVIIYFETSEFPRKEEGLFFCFTKAGVHFKKAEEPHLQLCVPEESGLSLTSSQTSLPLGGGLFRAPMQVGVRPELTMSLFTQSLLGTLSSLREDV